MCPPGLSGGRQIHTVLEITNIKTETTRTKNEMKSAKGERGCQSLNIIYLRNVYQQISAKIDGFQRTAAR